MKTPILNVPITKLKPIYKKSFTCIVFHDKNNGNVNCFSPAIDCVECIFDRNNKYRYISLIRKIKLKRILTL